ncbi:MAG: hypothetical protein LUE93_06815 [Bacteroides sp.]|nr:hypothetical protein [Bacteroides sp.]
MQLVEPLSDIRENMVQESRNMFNIYIAVILFFLVNIFLGVLGTFWFRTQYRRHEIGLRLALGSTRNQVQGLLMAEGVLLLILAFLPAVIVCYHLQYAEFVLSYPVPLGWGRFFANAVNHIFPAYRYAYPGYLVPGPPGNGYGAGGGLA